MIFATTFSLTLDIDGSMLSYHSKLFALTRVSVGLLLSIGVDNLFTNYPLYNPVYQSNQFGTIFFLDYLLPYMLTTFLVYGVAPPLAWALFFNKVYSSGYF
jgi:hypothetical protein